MVNSTLPRAINNNNKICNFSIPVVIFRVGLLCVQKVVFLEPQINQDLEVEMSENKNSKF